MSDETTETQLDWEKAGEDTLEARGTDYVVSRGIGDEPWLAQHGEDELGWRDDPEKAKRLCQLHRDSELAWTPKSPCYVTAHGYHCDPAPDGAWGAWQGETLLSEHAEAWQAQEACQAHHRALGLGLFGRVAHDELLPAEPPELKWRKERGQKIWRPTTGEPYSVAEAEGAYVATLSGDEPVTLGSVVVGHGTKKSALAKAQRACESHAAKQRPAPDGPSKPERELVTRNILCDLTPEEHAAAGQRLAELDDNAEAAERAVKAESDRYKERRKELEEAWGALVQEKRELRQVARTGQEYRELQVHEQLSPDAGDGSPRDVILTDPETGEELDRRPATKGELQKWLPKVPEEAQTQQEAAADRILGMVDLDSETPAEEQIADAAEKAAGALGSTEPPADPLPPHLDISIKLSWRHLTDDSGQKVYATSESYPRYYVDRDDTGKRRVQYQPAEDESRLVPRASGPAAPRLKDCFAAAHEDNQTRLRWPPAAIEGENRRVLLSSDGRYQLHQVRGDDDSWPDAWRAELVGVLGSPNEQLNSYNGEPLLEAQATCQADADAQRAGTRRA